MTTLLLALGQEACRDGCAPPTPEESPGGLLRRVPADVLGLLHMPRGELMLEQLEQLHDRLLPAFPDLRKVVADLKARLGFDPLQPDTMRGIGLDPKGEVLVAANEHWVLIGLTLTDSGDFDTYLRGRFDKEMPGELVFREVKAGKRKAFVVSPVKPDGAPPVFAYVLAGKQVFIVPATSPFERPVDPVAVLSRIFELSETASLRSQAAFKGLVSTVRKGSGALLWLNTQPLAKVGAAQARKQGDKEQERIFLGVQKALRGIALGLQLSKERIHISGRAVVEPGQLVLMKTQFATTGRAPDFGSLAGSDTVLFLRGALNPARALRFLKGFVPGKKRIELEGHLEAAKKAGFDIEAEVSATLTGHMAFSFHRIDLSGGLQRILADPKGLRLGIMDTATYVQLSDPARGDDLLQGLVQAGQHLRLSVDKEEKPGGVLVYTVKREGVVTATWTRKGDMLGISTGTGRAGKVLLALQGKATGLSQVVEAEGPSKALGQEGQAGLYLSFENLLKSFPILFLMAPKAIATLNALRDLHLYLYIVEDGMAGELALSFKPARPAKP